MSMVESAAISAAIAELQSKGFDTTNPHFKGNVMVEALVNAIIAEVRKATVISAGGGPVSGHSTATVTTTSTLIT